MHMWEMVRRNWHGQRVGTSQNRRTTSLAPKGLFACDALRRRQRSIAKRPPFRKARVGGGPWGAPFPQQDHALWRRKSRAVKLPLKRYTLYAIRYTLYAIRNTPHGVRGVRGVRGVPWRAVACRGVPWRGVMP